MFVCTTDLYEYMNSLRKDVCNLFVNTHVRIQIYREFYLCIIYIANEGRHVRIIYNRIKYSLCITQFTPVCRQCFISSYWQRTFAFKMYDSFNFLLTTLTFKHGRYLQFPKLIIFISWVAIFLPLVHKVFLCRYWYNQILVYNILLIWRLWAVRKSQQGVLITKQNVLIVKLYLISCNFNTSRSFIHSWLITRFVTRLTRQVPQMEKGTAYPSKAPEFSPGFWSCS
jgi:hypothetical protein